MRPNPSAPRPHVAVTSLQPPSARGPAATPHDKFSPPAAVKPAEVPRFGGEAESADERAARAGGFHESSYELQAGLQVSESEWPDDVTVPGKLGER